MKSICYFLNLFLLYFIGVLLTTQTVNGADYSESDLDTLLLRNGQSVATDNEAAESRVPKDIQELVSSAPSVKFESIPKRLQPIIQYALDRPYPGNGIEAPPGTRSNNKLKKTIVYLITSRLRQRGPNNEIPTENEQENENSNGEYGPPATSQGGYRTVLQEVKPNQNQNQQKSVTRTVLQPKSQYSSPGRNSQRQQQQQQRQQSYNAPVPAVRTAPSVLTIHPRPTAPSPDFEIIRTVSAEASDAILAFTQKQNLRSAYRAAYQQPSYQQQQHHNQHVEIQQEQAQPSGPVRFVHTPPQTSQDVDEGLAVLGGPEGLTDIVSKIEGLGDNPEPNQLILTAGFEPAPNPYSQNGPVDVIQIDNGPPPPPPPPQHQEQHQQHHTSPNEYITYLNPPLRAKPIGTLQASPIHFDGALKTLPFKRINRFFQNVLKSFRSNLANLRSLGPKVTYESEPWQSSGSNNNNKYSPKAPSPQEQNKPVLVSTTTYTEPHQSKTSQGNVYH